MILLDGKATAATIRAEIKEEVTSLAARFGRRPGLAVVLVGNDPASQVYVRNKERACEDCGIVSMPHRLENASQLELEGLIQQLNRDVNVDGILVQLPLPKGLDSQRILDLIDPNKDVDGFHPVNVGKLSLGLPGFRPCTPAGVITLLKRYNLDPACKKAVVIGRSNIVGKPLAMMLSQSGPCANATVTLCHSRTADLKAECREADFVFAAIGVPGFVTADMVKEGAVVVDVGINRTDEGLAGDCDFEGLKDKVHAMTPVPGGVGPMTIAQLMVNTLEAYKLHVGA
ncbi:bifunctional methylenetetrahydrofolate dehydrogenase/methenyltetrahydrofolate cyclohydrolase FolD [Pseudodesulfovibrio sp. F-1]|uniref:Bifunctional protein FolD n=1 Tax=Pseudodesulfovibrio alkaliphilus TaxID=2661613 RepID=A0A7K1KR55_9BACT|nr:bifunctional methylenetetrahydrofolate dehydrogenase/methenyltetrahydrofolate cyclohydrolase FolD [Pseudodesulfovibrio alkaliphilus]MUM78568.1 bifunctional methylenetetrahydrofolate dehydrogenase/methenyltetrahydrofolate cyclohydrolase FolD [Pseudodesulfovibrio alkaliphilus]